MLAAEFGIDDVGWDIEPPPIEILDIDIWPPGLDIEDLTDVDGVPWLLEDDTAEQMPYAG